jgi:hypothetical protein
LTADALLMYGVDVRHTTKLADWCPGLLKVVKQKLRGDDADRAKNIVAQHNRHMDETLNEEVRNYLIFLIGLAKPAVLSIAGWQFYVDFLYWLRLYSLEIDKMTARYNSFSCSQSIRSSHR